MIQRLSAVGANLLTYFIRSGYACRRGLPGGNGYAGSALHPQGTMSLDPYRRKTVVLLVLGDCLCCMTAGAVSTQAWRLALSGSGAPFGVDCLAAMVMRAPPCLCKGHCPLTRIGAKLSFCLFWVTAYAV